MQKQGRSLNALVCAALLVLVFCGCASETVEPPPAAAPQQAAQLPRSVKGYELYSWRSGETWQFTLITGTNRLKTLAEIASPENVEEGDSVKVSAVGLPELKSVLGRLPSGSFVSWQSARHLDPSSLQAGPDLVLPPDRVVRQVRSYCRKLGLDVQMGR